ncbi:serine protease family S26A, putative [Phytophthora infestans T30-4]|uniref:Serine protease family S26A, putative n=1 Tax=Phytophthora infestans (strain T30-4) TaxID=403677 RepID=D0P111_PHYIT|nr:serine protease family S26A, putative [Phytophthora infestans T30-4]EEY53723.1 serine protease family S26A, putative [Phytophthora infestans T30-4]|eukprot:XP_002896010.1 serine protease family S26A, putative [Phytophthora infestans T30-4]
MLAKLARNGVLIAGWATMTKKYFFDIKYGMGVSMVPSIPDGSFIVVEHLSRRWCNWERGELEGDVVELQPRFDDNYKDIITVPKGHVWVEGDNATCSIDSRYFGAVPVALLTGRPYWIVSLCGTYC